LQQKNGFQGINESEFLMVTKNLFEVAVVGVSVKRKRDDHVSNF